MTHFDIIDIETILAMISCCTVPIILFFDIYCFIKLQQHWNEQYFIRRRQLLVLVSINAVCFYSIAMNIYAIEILLLKITNINMINNIKFACVMLYLLLLSCTVGLGGTCYLLRWWLLYYDMQLSQLLKNKDWQMTIDPNIVKNNWYLNPENQRKYGHKGKYLLLFGWICDFIICGIVFILRLINYNEQNYITAADITIYVYCGIKIVPIGVPFLVKLNRFTFFDNFGIFDEAKSIIVCCIVILLVSVIKVTILHLIPEATTIMSFIHSGIAFIFCSIMMYFSVPWIVKKHKNDKNRKNNKMEKSAITEHWHLFVTKPMGYEQFMNHLQSEFSIENLLFITEYVQLKDVLKRKYPNIINELINNNRNLAFNVNLPQIPQSMLEMTYENDNIDKENQTKTQNEIEHMTNNNNNNNNNTNNNHNNNNNTLGTKISVGSDNSIECSNVGNNCKYSRDNNSFSCDDICIIDDSTIELQNNNSNNNNHNNNNNNNEPVKSARSPKIGWSPRSPRSPRTPKTPTNGSRKGSKNIEVIIRGIRSMSKSSRDLDDNDNNIYNNKNNNNNDSNNELIRELPPIIPVSLIAKKLYNKGDIIESFRELYKKYIDSNNAPYMINIASQNRDALMISLDCNYFQHQRQIANRQLSRRASLSMLAHHETSSSFHFLQNISSKLRTSNNNANTQSQCDIDGLDQLDSYIKQIENEKNNQLNNENNENNKDKISLINMDFIKNDKSIEYLLKRLIEEMDAAAREISMLMSDSFLRFTNKMSL